MSEPTADVSVEGLRELYRRLGLAPTDEEITGAIFGLQRLVDADRVLIEELDAPREPMTAPRLGGA